MPWPSRLVSVLAPALASNPHGLPFPFPESGWLVLSSYPRATLLALIRFLAYLAAFTLAAYVFDFEKRKSFLVRTLIFLGCFEAIFGIVQYLTGWQKIFSYTKRFDLWEATGTYINRNHFAGLLELTAPFALAMGFYAFLIWSEERHLPGQGGTALSSAGFRTVFYFFLALVMGLAVFFSYSRMGILGFLCSNIFIVLLAQLRSRQRGWVLGMALLGVCLALYGLWVGLGPVIGGFELFREPGYIQMEGRMTLWHDALRLLRERPLMGTGLGTFGVAYRRYQTAMIDFNVDHAHSDYLEFATDTGLVGASLLFIPIFWLFFRMVISFLNDPRRFRCSITLGCIGSTLGMLLHSSTDFNLQIPANALIFAVVLGIGYKTSCVDRGETPLLDSASTG